MSPSKRHERCAYCDWRDLLTARETVLLVIHGGTATVSGIAAKLWDLGVRFKPAENEVRARLCELRKLRMVAEVRRGGQVWALTDPGEQALTEITPQLYDDELASFSNRRESALESIGGKGGDLNGEEETARKLST